MADSLTIRGHTVTMTTFDYGGLAMGGMPQPHFSVKIVAPDGTLQSCPMFKLPRRLVLRGSLPIVPSDRFVKENEIGGGNFGKVYKGNSETGLPVAIKVSKLRKGKLAEDIASTLMEGAILSLIFHRNIIRMVCVASNEAGLPWIVFEFAENGSLYGTLDKVNECARKEKPLPISWTEEVKLRISYGIISGLNHLHCHQGIHRDLTARNVLLMENYEPKLCDFGLTSFLHAGEQIIDDKNDSAEVRRTAYSLQYCAPEVFPRSTIIKMKSKSETWPAINFETLEFVESGDEDENSTPAEEELTEHVEDPTGKYGYPSDIWAYGVLLYQIWSDGSYIPYSDTNEHPSIEQIKSILVHERKSPWDFKPLDEKQYPTVCNILRRAFKHNPKSRMAAPVVKKKLEDEIRRVAPHIMEKQT